MLVRECAKSSTWSWSIQVMPTSSHRFSIFSGFLLCWYVPSSAAAAFLLVFSPSCGDAHDAQAIHVRDVKCAMRRGPSQFTIRRHPVIFSVFTRVSCGDSAFQVEIACLLYFLVGVSMSLDVTGQYFLWLKFMVQARRVESQSGT